MLVTGPQTLRKDEGPGREFSGRQEMESFKRMFLWKCIPMEDFSFMQIQYYVVKNPFDVAFCFSHIDVFC